MRTSRHSWLLNNLLLRPNLYLVLLSRCQCCYLYQPYTPLARTGHGDNQLQCFQVGRAWDLDVEISRRSSAPTLPHRQIRVQKCPVLTAHLETLIIPSFRHSR
ncbi:hypothetical protein BDZ91DRAFT_256522 [Kalaharituber pfeilii]|nr:hypothetical protein BDZ91DRAFT_256522 [Kalaharituber pfeilii]